MSTPVGPESLNAGGRRWQVTLADLIVLVLAAGVATGLARGTRGVPATRPMTWGLRSDMVVVRSVGLVLEVLAVFLIFILAGAVIGLNRRGRSGTGHRIGRVGLIDWRVLAIALLMCFVAEQWDVLHMDFSIVTNPALWRGGWEPIYQVREVLFPICGLLGMLGLTMGMGAGAILDGPKTRRPRPYWLFVPLAALVALLLMMQPDWWLMILQLVLNAIEAVYNAMHHSLVGRPSLSTRLLRAGIDASVAGPACLGLAMIVAHDFERARRDEPWAATRRGWVLRLILLVGTMAAGMYQGLVTIPAIEPHLVNGFRSVLGSVEVAMIVSGFALFAAGLAARSIGGRPAAEVPRWLLRLRTPLRPVVLTLVVLSALNDLPSSTKFDPGVPTWVGRLVDVVSGVNARLWSCLPDSTAGELKPWLGITRLIWILPTAGLSLMVLEIILTPRTQHPPPFQAAAESREQAFRFLWLTVALTVVCLAAIPILLVSSQVLVHLHLRGRDFTTLGWPRLF